MELENQIAKYLSIEKESVSIDRIIDGIVFFHTNGGAAYTCKISKNGNSVLNNSVRADFL